MKLKGIFLVLNVVLLISFIFAFLMPLFFFGLTYAAGFWLSNLWIFLLFVILLAGLDVYLLRNWVVLGFLENNDFQGLLVHFKNRSAAGRIRGSNQVRLWISSCIATGRMDELATILEWARENNPAMVSHFALELSLPAFMSRQPEAVLAHFESCTPKDALASRWIRWNKAFAGILQDRTGDALTQLDSVLAEKTDPVVRLFTLSLKKSLPLSENDQKELEIMRRELSGKYVPELLRERIKRYEGNIQVAFFRQFSEQALQWLYGEAA